MLEGNMFRRETIIALRARHQAYRIASDIANPHVETPAPTQPVLPMDPPDWGWSDHQRRLRRGALVMLAWVWGLVAAYWIFYWISTRG
jgi:hypothetical protein